MRFFARPEVIAAFAGLLFMAALLAGFFVFVGPDHSETRPPEYVKLGFSVEQGPQPNANGTPEFNATETASPDFAAYAMATVQASAPGAQYLAPMTRPTPGPGERIIHCYGSDIDYCRQPSPDLAIYDEVDQCPGTGHRVCLVPLGDVDKGLLEYLLSYFQTNYGIEIHAVAAQTITARMDPTRRQFEATDLENMVSNQFGYRDAILIGITPLDIFSDSMPTWRYEFGERVAEYSNASKLPAGARAFNQGVISSFRMDPRSYGQKPNDALMYLRMRKMVSRYIGLMYYNLPLTKDRTSVLAQSILGLDDLDAVTQELPR